MPVYIFARIKLLSYIRTLQPGKSQALLCEGNRCDGNCFNAENNSKKVPFTKSHHPNR